MEKILHLTWSLKLAGAERVAHTLCLAARVAGFEPWVCALSDATPEERAEWESGAIRPAALPKRPGFDPSLAFRLRSFLKENGIRLIHTHNAVGALYGGLARTKEVHHVHTEHSNLPVEKRVLRQVASRMLASAHIVADSRKVAVTLTRREGIDPRRVRVIYNGVEPTPPAGAAGRNLKEALGIPKNARILGTAGNLRPVKGQASLLEAFSLLRTRFPDLHLVILGEGSERPALENLAEDLRIKPFVRLPGFVADVRNFAGQFDVFALSSRSEGLPLSLLEAMAAMRPCVSTSVGGIPEVVRDGENGLLVPPESAEALARSAARLLSDPDLSARLGRAARETVLSNFDARTMADSYVSLYREIL